MHGVKCRTSLIAISEGVYKWDSKLRGATVVSNFQLWIMNKIVIVALVALAVMAVALADKPADKSKGNKALTNLIKLN